MAASKLSIYNQALGHLGERRLATLSEPREPRRVLEGVQSGIEEIKRLIRREPS